MAKQAGQKSLYKIDFVRKIDTTVQQLQQRNYAGFDTKFVFEEAPFCGWALGGGFLKVMDGGSDIREEPAPIIENEEALITGFDIKFFLKQRTLVQRTNDSLFRFGNYF